MSQDDAAWKSGTRPCPECGRECENYEYVEDGDYIRTVCEEHSVQFQESRVKNMGPDASGDGRLSHSIQNQQEVEEALHESDAEPKMVDEVSDDDECCRPKCHEEPYKRTDRSGVLCEEHYKYALEESGHEPLEVDQ